MRFYICSTYVDLAEHRKAAIDAFQELNRRAKGTWQEYDYIDPENLSVSGTPPIDVCLRELKESGYFILILGWRYGYIPESSEKSIVELESVLSHM
jgi:hypothetical protein